MYLVINITQLHTYFSVLLRIRIPHMYILPVTSYAQYSCVRKKMHIYTPIWSMYMYFPGAWRWPLTPSTAEIKNEQELYILSSQAPPWRVAGQLYFTCIIFQIRSLGVDILHWPWCSFIANKNLICKVNETTDTTLPKSIKHLTFYFVFYSLHQIFEIRVVGHKMIYILYYVSGFVKSCF
jgi:hypothetical protein